MRIFIFVLCRHCAYFNYGCCTGCDIFYVKNQQSPEPSGSKNDVERRKTSMQIENVYNTGARRCDDCCACGCLCPYADDRYWPKISECKSSSLASGLFNKEGTLQGPRRAIFRFIILIVYGYVICFFSTHFSICDKLVLTECSSATFLLSNNSCPTLHNII